MSLNLSTVFSEADSILNSLLSKYVGLKFIEFDEDNDNRPTYLGNTITKGFYYKEKKLPVTGEVVETLGLVPETEEINQHVKDADMIELIEENGDFLRCKFKTLKKPFPPRYEWKFLLTPNEQDRTAIT